MSVLASVDIGVGRVQAEVMANVVNINEVLEGHVALDVECVDRMLLNAYVPDLQVGGQVVRLLTGHLGNPVPSPALFAQIGNRFVREVKASPRPTTSDLAVEQAGSFPVG